MKGRILVVDDERHQRDILKMILDAEGYEAVTAGTGRQAVAAVRAQPAFDVALTDLKMPDLNGIELLGELLRLQPSLCVVLMTAHGSIDSAVEAMRKGAFDYLTKPLEQEELLLVLKRAMERTQLVRENRMLQEQLRDRFRIENLVGSHGSMQDVFRIVHKVAASASTVLIYGESGTGKELVARALHTASERRGKAVLRGERRGAPREHPGGGAVRPREGRLHRGRHAQDRPLRAGLGLDALPRRSRRPEA